MLAPIRSGPSRLRPTTAWLVALCLLAGPAAADESIPNDCQAGWQGEACANSTDCQYNPMASVCVDGACQIPCEAATDGAEPGACAVGETCVAGIGDQGTTHYCRPGRFHMDLNLLDRCIVHFLQGVQPDLGAQDPCSLERNLNQLLDQNGDQLFDIFDVDGCVRAFLSAEPCDQASQTCPPGDAYCDIDDDCGVGLHCNPDLHRCERECGYVANRQQNLIDVLDRECSGRLKVCDYPRGRCVPVDLAGSTCSVNKDCPAGAYCFLGECAPTCTRSLDCPDSDWVCSATNTCRPLPPPDGSPPFDPKTFSVQFARKQVMLDPIQAESRVPLVIMDLNTRKQLFDRPEVRFGYRLQLAYARKQAARCRRPVDEWTPEDIDDCLIDPDDEWIVLDKPFGTLGASGQPGVGLSLNWAAVERLSPGLYEATLTAVFTNGGSDSVTFSFRKTSVSGEYIGRMSVYLDGPDNALGTTNVGAQLYVDTDAAQIEWDQLLQAENLAVERDFIDITSGYPISGYLHGNDSLLFNAPGSAGKTDNDIPLRGIWSPELGRVRLIAVIDLPADFCLGEDGACDPGRPEQLKVTNPFGRPIRRVVQFVGPYNERSRLFEGRYRETLSGLTPYDLTLDGGFRLTQVGFDDAPVVLGAPLLPAAAPAVGFPEAPELLAAVDDQIDDECLDFSDERNMFQDEGSFDAYTGSLGAPDQSNNGSVFGQLERFSDRVAGALSVLNNAQAPLTLHDFLRGEITFCEQQQGNDCVDEAAVRCGLALHRKALLSNWVDRSALPSPVTPGGFDLFCAEGSYTPGCDFTGANQPALVTMQEHNRFFQELYQTLSFQAGAALSDAFYLMYRVADGLDLQGQSALSAKATRAREAYGWYELAQEEVVAPTAAAILFDWPMSAFQGRGQGWLKSMHVLLDDRLRVMTTLMDVKRRLFEATDEADFAFAQQLMQQEYLTQVFLAALEQRWQQEHFAYAGQARSALQAGELLLAKVDETRNPLGLHPDRIYFENGNLNLTNWENYQARILAPGTGLLALAQAEVQAAITNLKAALTSQNTFEANLLALQQQLDATLDDLCGDPDPLPPACDLGAEDKGLESECVGPDCLFQFACTGAECDDVIQLFEDGTSGGLGEVACRADTAALQVQIGGTSRPCVRGRVGSMLQEKVMLELQRDQVVRKVQVLIQRIAGQQTYLAETVSANTALLDYLDQLGVQMIALQEGLLAAEHIYETASIAAEAADCMTIVGVAAGTNCPQKAIVAVAKISALDIKYSVVDQLGVLKQHLGQVKEITMQEHVMDDEVRRMRMDLDNMVTAVQDHITEYELLTQQLFNLDLRIQDAHYQAQRTADRYTESLGSLVDRLVGSESGSVLVRNRHVLDSEAAFEALLVETYKMAMAFAHRYNMDDNGAQLAQRVYQLVTLDDVQQFLTDLDSYAFGYCGANGLDCDYVNNPRVLRFSMRDELFPGLHDIVDAKTGKVLTKGQQFNNLITSSAFVKRRIRAGEPTDQIELPFTIWLSDRGSASRPLKAYMLPNTECNHLIVARQAGGQAGTVAVNVIGTRLSGDLSYELWRGNTDFIRSCDADGNAWPIDKFLVGYPPQNANSSLAVPPTFVTHSVELPACENDLQLEDSLHDNPACFFYFGRDRSLAAPDWKLVIPRLDDEGGNNWVLGEGLPDHERPIIEDIVLYLRHSGRPINDP